MGLSEVSGLIGWWSPNPRGILPLDGLRVTRSMRQSAKKFDVRVDTCFARVMRSCGDPSRGDSWITGEFVDVYTRLHELGWAHSVEVFNRSGQLAGGLYGVRIGGIFAGESMFHLERDASKVALMALVDLMRSSGMSLLDVQWNSEHLASLGVVDIPRRTYLSRLASATGSPDRPASRTQDSQLQNLKPKAFDHPQSFFDKSGGGSLSKFSKRLTLKYQSPGRLKSMSNV